MKEDQTLSADQTTLSVQTQDQTRPGQIMMMNVIVVQGDVRSQLTAADQLTPGSGKEDTDHSSICVQFKMNPDAQ